MNRRTAMASALALSLYSKENSREISRIHNAQEVFHELMQTPAHAIPRELLESAKCIAIIPGQKKAGDCDSILFAEVVFSRLSRPNLSRM